MTTQIFIHFYQRHRGFIGPFFVVVALGVYVDLKPLCGQFYEVLEQEKKVAQQLEEKERALQQAGPIASRLRAQPLRKATKPLLDQVLQAAVGNACLLSSVQTALKSGADPVTNAQRQLPFNEQWVIKMQLRCDFLSFYRFLETVLRQALPLHLDHFSLKDAGEAAVLMVQFSAFPWALGMTATSDLQDGNGIACCARDPFHESTGSATETAVFSQEVLQQVVLEQIRYVGYWEEKGKTGALVLLPNGRIYDIYPGSRLGKEQAQILKIHSQQLILWDPHQQKRLQLRRVAG